MFIQDTKRNKITVLGKTFDSEKKRREYFRNELRKKLPELRQMEGFPIGEDEDIINLSDPPFYTACPNPWLNDFIAEWEEEKQQMANVGIRSSGYEVDEPYASDVSEGKNNPFYTLHTYHTKVPHPAIMRYLLHYTEPGDIVFDGFAGTGMTGVAAKQCGNANSSLKQRLAVDFKENNNGKAPIWGERKAIVSDLAPAASFISSNLNCCYDTSDIKKSFLSKLEKVYEKYKWMYETHHVDNTKGEVKFIVWSEVTTCPNCSNEFILWDQMADTQAGRMKSEFKCPKCLSSLTKKKCLDTLQTDYDFHLDKSIRVKKYTPVLIKYTARGKAYYKAVDKNDLELDDRIKKVEINNWIPTNRLPVGDESRRNDKYGMSHVHHFYTKRNLIFISELWNICNNQEKFIATSIISRNMSKLNRYVLKPRTPHGEVNGPLSGTLYISSEYVEQNPFDLLVSKIPKFSWDNSNVISSVNAAQNVGLHDNSIDYIFTDPPFGANIMYSELNYLWESWLKVFTSIEPEAIENRTQGKSTLTYQNIMHECFKEYNRILKPGKWMTVEFSNTSAAVWNGIQTAIQNSGFIIANVAALDKKHGGIKSMTYSTAVKQDLVISCYKPSTEFDSKFQQNRNTDIGIWDFIEEHLQHLPIHYSKDNATTAIIERSPKILFDRLIAFYIQKGLPVPIDAGKFHEGLRVNFIERDGMFFTNEQVQEYDEKKSEAPKFIQFSLLVSSEQDGVFWLKNLLKEKPLAYQDIQPQWMQALAGVRKGDLIPELSNILEENFLKDYSEKWYLPDPENEADLEMLKNKRLIKQFESYKSEVHKSKGKIKEARVESLRAGFKQCYQDKDFQTIVQVGDRIPNNLLMEDEVLLQFYDIANSRVS